MDIWKSYIWTADKDVNMKAIFAVMNTTWALVEIRLLISWLVSSVVRALHRYRKGHGFKSRTGLNFFRPYFHYRSNSVHYCEDRFHINEALSVTNVPTTFWSPLESIPGGRYRTDLWQHGIYLFNMIKNNNATSSCVCPTIDHNKNLRAIFSLSASACV